MPPWRRQLNRQGGSKGYHESNISSSTIRTCARLALLLLLNLSSAGFVLVATNPQLAPRVESRYHEHMLRVKLLDPGARLPVVAHPGEDLGYDVFSLETVLLESHKTIRVRTGISVEARHPETGGPLGLLVRDRSSMASKGIATTAGVIDAGYRGEVQIVMTNLGATPIELKAGEKIAQMVPVPVLTGPVEEVETLEESARLAKGFGSSGR